MWLVALGCVSSAIMVTSIFIIESRSLRKSTYAYAIQSALLSCTFALIAVITSERHMFIWCLTALVTKAVAVPLMILWAIKQVREEIEMSPLLPLIPSFAVECCIIALSFSTVSYFFPVVFPIELERYFKLLLSISVMLLFVGVYGMMSRRCALKQAICLCHMENGVHLLLASLAYQSPITVEIGILTDAIVAIAILLYLAVVIKQVLGTLDTLKLSILRW